MKSFRGMSGPLMQVGSNVTVLFDDERDRGKDSVKLIMTVLAGGDDHKVTVAEGLTREQADTMLDALFTAIRDEEESVDMTQMVGPV